MHTGPRDSATPPESNLSDAAGMIAGIVLAAGRSERMGEPKALLEVDGESFLAIVVRALQGGGCEEVIVVTGASSHPEMRRIAAAARDLGERTVENPVEGAEQIDSLRVGLRALAPGAEAAVVTPVDFPRITPAIVRALIDGFRQRSAPIVVPVYRGTRGHPTLFARTVFGDLFADPLPDGARSVVEAHESTLDEVPVGDAAVLQDVDTPADYRRLLEDAG